MEEATGLLLETGFRIAICRLVLSDKASLRYTLVDYHCMLKVKACMDQFAEGLEELDVLDIIRKHPDAMRPFFVDECRPFTAGGFVYMYMRQTYKLVSIQFGVTSS